MQQLIYHGATIKDRSDRVGVDFPSAKYLYTHLSGVDSSIKIEDVRSVTGALSVTSPMPRLIWLEEASRLTIPAQNSLLKILEEPPRDVTFVLSLSSPSSLLSTIRSRCYLVALVSEGQAVDDDALRLIKGALKATSGERVALAVGVGKKRDQALSFIDSVISSIHLKIGEGGSSNQLQFLAQVGKQAVDTRIELASNTNVSLSLENFFLALPRMS